VGVCPNKRLTMFGTQKRNSAQVGTNMESPNTMMLT